MKIALPSKLNRVDDHFGHCEYFTVFTVDQGKKRILEKETVASPAGCGCKSNVATVLADMGVTLMLAGNMGEGAVRKLDASGINVIRGCSGIVDHVAEKWLEGAIKDSGDACHAHDHGHECSH